MPATQQISGERHPREDFLKMANPILEQLGGSGEITPEVALSTVPRSSLCSFHRARCVAVYDVAYFLFCRDLGRKTIPWSQHQKQLCLFSADGVFLSYRH